MCDGMPVSDSDLSNSSNECGNENRNKFSHFKIMSLNIFSFLPHL